MADPKPWLVILALQAQLQDITKSNGYLTDAGTSIWTEPAQRPETAALGISIVTRQIDRWEGERPNKRGRTLQLALEAAISTDLDTAHEYAHQLIEDVEVCLAKNIAVNTLPAVPGVTAFEIDSIEMADRPEGLPVIAVAMTISAGYLR